MAIKVSGTTVINDSRVLENVTGFKNVGGQSILGDGNISVGVSADHGTITQTTVGGVSTATFDLGTGTLFKHTLPSPTSEITSQTFAFTEALTSTQGGSWKFNIDAAPTTDNWRFDSYTTSSNQSTAGLSTTLTATFNKQGTQVLERISNTIPSHSANGNSYTYDLNTILSVRTTTTPWDFTSTSTYTFPSTLITFPSAGYSGGISPGIAAPTIDVVWSADGKAVYYHGIDVGYTFSPTFAFIYATIVLYLNTAWDLTSLSSATVIDQSALLSPLNADTSPRSWIVHTNGTKLTSIASVTGVRKFLTHTLSTPYNIATAQASPIETALPASVPTNVATYMKLANNDQHVHLRSFVGDGVFRRFNLPSGSADNITSITDTGMVSYNISGGIDANWLFKSDGSLIYAPSSNSLTIRSGIATTYRTIVWPNNITWPRETTAPTIIANTTKQIDILTFDGGTTYTGYYSVLPYTPKIRLASFHPFTGVYTVPSDVAMLEIIATAAGGAGGSCNPPGGGGSGAILARGGGAGAGARFILTTLSSSYTITLGARGRPAGYDFNTGTAAINAGTTTIVDAAGTTICSLPGGTSQPGILTATPYPWESNPVFSPAPSPTLNLTNRGFLIFSPAYSTGSGPSSWTNPTLIHTTFNSWPPSGISGQGFGSIINPSLTPGVTTGQNQGNEGRSGAQGCGGSGAAVWAEALSGGYPVYRGGEGGYAAVIILEYLK